MNEEAKTFRNALDNLFQEEFETSCLRQAVSNDEFIFEDEKKPVDIIQFVDDPYYLGGQIDLQPKVREILWDIEDPTIREADLELGKGSGKSEISSISQIYGAYLLTRLKNPQQLYKLAPSTIIAAVNVSVGRDQARDVVFQSVRVKIENSPYFRQLKPNILTREIQLQKHIRIYCGSSGDKAWLGFAIIRGVMDETNYMFDTQNRNVAHQLYDVLHGSMRTRFPGSYKLVAVSSVTTANTWLHRRVLQSQNLGSEYISRIPGLRLEVVPSASKNDFVRIKCSLSAPEEQIKRTIALEHQRDVLKIWKDKHSWLAELSK